MKGGRDMGAGIPDSEGGAEFLRADFGESFRQMCHYDSQIVDVCKFAFVGYSTVLGVAIGLYKFGIEKKVNFVLPAGAIILVGMIVGVVVFSLVIRNRIYFVVVARYVNELRGHFLHVKPLGFENKTGMYTDWRRPPYFDVWSSQLLTSYMIGFFNAVLLGVLLYLAKLAWGWIVVLSVALLVLQIGFASWYLRRRDGESGEQAVFGGRKRRQNERQTKDNR